MPEYLPQASSFNELLQECFRLNRSIVEAAIELTAGAGVTGTQWGVLSALGQGAQPRTVAETARRMGLARQSVQRVADVLADSGLVRYLPSPEDRRTKRVDVTDAGRALLAKLDARQRDWVAEIVGDGTERDIKKALLLIKKIRKRIIQQAV